jgi:hypothetical protein
VTIYDAEGRILRAPVSTGRTGYETPAGIYSVIQKAAEHYSNLYDDAAMPFMQRITWSGIALHAGVLPGHPASHGCIRMPHAFAERLFDLTKLGMRVVVARSDVSPVAIAHPLLFKPIPVRGTVARATPPAVASAGEGEQPMRLGVAPAASGLTPPAAAPGERPQTWRQIAAARAAEAEAATHKAEGARRVAAKASLEAGRLTKTLRIAGLAKARAEAQLVDAERTLEAAASPEAKERAEAVKARVQAKLAELQAQLGAAAAEAGPKAEAAAQAREAVKAAEAQRVAAVAAAREAASKIAPVSVFISRETQRLYVRQSFRPVLDVPVTIRDPDKPLGTYVFTALDYANDGADVRWSALAMYPAGAAPRPAGDTRTRRRRGAPHETQAALTDAAAAKAVLDRIAIPEEVRERVSEVVSPGSSLIVSDEGVHKETSKGTDFIVVMSGEPQGGIKIRRRSQGPWSRYDRGYGGAPYGRYPYGGGPFFRW